MRIPKATTGVREPHQQRVMAGASELHRALTPHTGATAKERERGRRGASKRQAFLRWAALEAEERD